MGRVAFPGSGGFVAGSDGLAAAVAPLDLAEGWTFSLSVMVWGEWE